jgi:hypothetical protein
MFVLLQRTWRVLFIEIDWSDLLDNTNYLWNFEINLDFENFVNFLSYKTNGKN